MSFFIIRFDPGAKYGGYNQFDCRHTVINKFVKDSLKKQVKQGLSVAYALLEDDGATQRFAGFFTIASHTIALSALGALQRGGLPKTIPCVRLVMLGVHHADAGQGLGLQLMNHALDIVKVGAQSIGSYGLYLDADAEALGFYQKLGFVPLEGDKSPAPSPMFLPMSAIP
jgi:GNAT superfamily N-acetyltransferase